MVDELHKTPDSILTEYGRIIFTFKKNPAAVKRNINTQRSPCMREPRRGQFGIFSAYERAMLILSLKGKHYISLYIVGIAYFRKTVDIIGHGGQKIALALLDIVCDLFSGFI